MDVAFAEFLKATRAARNFSPEDFARQTGVSPDYCADLESAEWGVTLSALIRIARGLGCAPGELVAATLARLPAEDSEAAGERGPDQ